MTSTAARMLAHVHRQFHRPESGNILRCPLAHFHAAVDTYDAVYVNPLYVFCISLVLSVLGLLFLRRYHKDIILK